MEDVNYDNANGGSRIMLFQVHIQSIFKEIATGVSLETFKLLFGDILKNRPSVIENLHKVYVEQLYKGMMEEMQLKEFIVDEKLNEKFNKMARLTQVEPMEKDAVAWRPVTGDIHQQLRSHDMEEKLKCKRDLEEYVLMKEARVERLKMKLSAFRAKVLRLDADITAMRKAKEDKLIAAKKIRGTMFSVCVETSERSKKQTRDDNEKSRRSIRYF